MKRMKEIKYQLFRYVYVYFNDAYILTMLKFSCIHGGVVSRSHIYLVTIVTLRVYQIRSVASLKQRTQFCKISSLVPFPFALAPMPCVGVCDAWAMFEITNSLYCANIKPPTLLFAVPHTSQVYRAMMHDRRYITTRERDKYAVAEEKKKIGRGYNRQLGAVLRMQTIAF